jgi:hypothetical protein
MIAHSGRARGGNRGGVGGGYERTDPDYDRHRLHQMRREFESLDGKWKEEYLAGLSAFERNAVQRRRTEL